MSDVNNASPQEVAEAEAETLADVLVEMRHHLRTLATPHAPRRLVDISANVASATSVQLRQVVSALTLLDTIVYSASAAAVITIGARQIPVPQGANALRVGQLVVYPGDVIALALSGASPTPGAQFLEVIGWQVPPSEHFEVVR